MLKLKKLRDLTIETDRAIPQGYVYSASGLVEFQDQYYVVADTELHLAVFSRDPSKAGKLLRLFPGELPEEKKERKKEKPDLESITILPPSVRVFASGGALLMVPSMSRKNRVRGALLVRSGTEWAEPIPIDFSQIYTALAGKVKELNIEGIAFSREAVKFFHRGTKGNSQSAVIDFNIAAFLHDLFDTHSPRAKHILGIRTYELGEINGCKLAFTDACTLPDERILFLAAAENSRNAYDDGASEGSVIGIMDRHGSVVKTERIEGRFKLEGVTARQKGQELDLCLVSDADDEKVPSAMFSASWSY